MSANPVEAPVQTALGGGVDIRPPKRKHGRTKRRRTPGQRLKHIAIVLLFLLPSAIPLVMFTFYPMAQALWTSFHEWNLISDMTWTGFDNYVSLFNSGETRAAFGNTLYYIVGYLPLVYIGGLALALALNSAIKGRNLLRGFYFLPVITSWIVVALVWRWLLNPSTGAINTALGFFGIEGPGWWADPNWFMPSVILASVWKDLGFVMVILLAGLQTIPTELYEAATLDGAGAWRRFWSVTLPLLSPATFFVIVISLINGFQVFDQVYAMSGGESGGAGQVVVQQIYDLTFRYRAAGEASALSWMLFIVVLAVTIIQLRGQKRWVHYA